MNDGRTKKHADDAPVCSQKLGELLCCAPSKNTSAAPPPTPSLTVGSPKALQSQPSAQTRRPAGHTLGPTPPHPCTFLPKPA